MSDNRKVIKRMARDWWEHFRHYIDGFVIGVVILWVMRIFKHYE